MSRKQLNLGGITLPIEAQTQTTAVLGIRDSGKTNTAAVIIEELLKLGQQAVIIDPTDAWWGLKSSADGKRPGFPVVVLGGKHQDVPLSPNDGALIADFVVEQRVSVVLSLRGFESKADELRFVTAFLRRLYYLKGQQDAPTPLTLVMDEASRHIPQFVKGDAAPCVGAVQQIVRQGRTSGFGIIVIDQRASTVNKDVLDMLDTLVMHRTIGPRDRKALLGWVEAHDTADRSDEFMGSLATLKRGEAWVWSPGFLDIFEKVQMRARETFDSSRTPKAGEKRVTPKKLADVDLSSIKQKLAATIETARKNDPDVLRKELAAARAQLTKGAAAIDSKQLNAVASEQYAKGWNAGILHQRRETKALRKELARAVSRLIVHNRSLMGLFTDYSGRTGELGKIIDTLDGTDDGTSIATPAEAKRLAKQITADLDIKPARASRKTPAQTMPTRMLSLPPSSPASNGDMPPVQQRVLSALAFFDSIGFSQPTVGMVAAFLDYHPRTPTFRNYLSALQTSGHLTHGSGVVEATAKGRSSWRLAESDNVNTHSALHQLWLSKLTPVLQRVLTPIIEAGQNGITIDALAAKLSYHPRTPTFRNYLSSLTTKELIEVTRGLAVPREQLFPDALL